MCLRLRPVETYIFKQFHCGGIVAFQFNSTTTKTKTTTETPTTNHTIAAAAIYLSLKQQTTTSFQPISLCFKFMKKQQIKQDFYILSQ